jgi:hypothetical protein
MIVLAYLEIHPITYNSKKVRDKEKKKVNKKEFHEKFNLSIMNKNYFALIYD